MTDPLFDARAFGRRLQDALHRRAVSLRRAADAAGVSPSTFSRACHGEPNTSHENVLRLTAWLEQGEQEQAA